MKNLLKRFLATVMVTFMVLSSIPLTHFSLMETDFDLSEIGITANAADKEIIPTAKNVVACFMANKSVWYNIDFFTTPYSNPQCTFLDLDHDGILELMTTKCEGTGWFSTTNYYKADLKNNRIHKMRSVYPEYDNLDFYKGYGLYRSKKTNQYYYHGYNYTRNGVYANGTSENFFWCEENVIQDKFLFFVLNNLIDGTANYTPTYYTMLDGEKVVSESVYNSQYKKFFADYTDMKLKYKAFSAKEFVNASEKQKTSMLLSSYNAFYHNGIVKMTFDEPEQSYNIGKDSKIQFTVKGSSDFISDFDKDDIKFTSSNKNILKIVDVEKVSTGKNTLKFKLNFVPLKEGETTLTLKCGKKEYDECIIKVEKPNELKLNISDPVECYELNGFFFNSNGEYSSGSVDLNVILHNTYKEKIKEYKIYDNEIKDSLAVKNVRVVFELEGEGFSFSNTEDVKTTEMHFRKVGFTDEKSIDAWPENPWLEKGVLKVFMYGSGDFGVGEIKNIKVSYKLYFDYATDKNVDDYNPENPENRSMKAEDSIEFKLQSYKSRYVLEHINAVALGGSYRNMIENSYAQSMVDLENTMDYKWFQNLSKGLLENITDVFVDVDAVVGYELMIVDLVSAINGDEKELVKMSNAYFGNAFAERCDKVLSTTMKIAKKRYNKKIYEELEKSISKADMAKVLSGDVTSGEAYDLFVETLNTDSGARALNNILFCNDVHKDVLKGYNLVSNTYNGYVKANSICSSLEAYDNMMSSQQIVLQKLRDKAKAENNWDLYAAVNDFVEYGKASDFEKTAYTTMIKACLSGQEIMGEVHDVIAKGIKKGFEEYIKSFVGDKLFTTVSGAASNVLLSYECGKLMSELLCNTEDYAQASWKAVAAGKTSGYMKSILLENISDLAGDSNLDTAFEKAQSLDCALVMYKELEIMAYDSVAEALEARGSSAILNLFEEKRGNYETGVAETLAGKARIATRICHDICLENIYAQILNLDMIKTGYIGNVQEGFTSYKTICVQCPVDVIVLGSDNKEFVKIDNNQVVKSSPDIIAAVVGNEKFVCLPSNDTYEIKITATDNGTMDYTVCEFGQEFESIRRVEYENLPLSKGVVYTSSVNNERYTDKEEYNLQTENNEFEASADDYVEISAISFSSETPESVYAGTDIGLEVVAYPINSSVKELVWSSSDESIAKVENGNLTALQPGIVTISCSVKDNQNVKTSVVLDVVECEHEYSDYVTVRESTCSEYGTKERKCSVCCKIEVEKITQLKSHLPQSESVYFEPTCTKNAMNINLCGNCNEICSYEEIPETKVKHQYSNYEFDDNATFASNATETSVCIYDCNKTNTRAVKGTKRILGTTSKITVSQASNAVTLSWNKVDYATGYIVYQKVSGKWNKVAKVNNKTTYKVASLKSACKYEFAVKAFVVENGKDIMAPKQKTISTYTRPQTVGTLKAKQTTTTVTLSWQKVSGATGYKIYKYNPTKKNYVELKTTKGTSYKVTKLKAGNDYKFAVKPYVEFADGTVLWASSYKSLSTATKPAAPSLKVSSKSKGIANFSWSNVNGESGYQLYYSTAKNGKYKSAKTYSANVCKGSKSKLVSKKTYYFKVRAYKKIGKTTIYGGWSTVKSVKIR